MSEAMSGSREIQFEEISQVEPFQKKFDKEKCWGT